MATDLDLPVATPEESERAVERERAEVASAVEPPSGYERIVGKRGGGAFVVE